MKTCRTCLLPETETNIAANRYECNRCRGRSYYERNTDAVKARTRARYAENRKEIMADQRRYHSLINPNSRLAFQAKKYGISLDQFFTMVELQGGVCAICSRVPKRWSIDHCHSTGKVRGLLCTTCNSGLGFFRDDTDVLHTAIGYLICSSTPGLSMSYDSLDDQEGAPLWSSG